MKSRPASGSRLFFLLHLCDISQPKTRWRRKNKSSSFLVWSYFYLFKIPKIGSSFTFSSQLTRVVSFVFNPSSSSSSSTDLSLSLFFDLSSFIYNTVHILFGGISCFLVNAHQLRVSLSTLISSGSIYHCPFFFLGSNSTICLIIVNSLSWVKFLILTHLFKTLW